MTLAAFLSWLSTPGGVSIAVGVLLSWIADYIPKYTYLNPKEKRLAFLAACLSVPMVAATFRALAGYAPWTLDPLYWQAITAGAAAFGFGTLVHTPKLPTISERTLLNRLLVEDMARKARR